TPGSGRPPTRCSSASSARAATSGPGCGAGALTFSRELLPIDLAVRDWSRRDQAVAQRLRRVDNRRMGYLRLPFGAICPEEKEVEARSMLAFSLVIGHHFLAADHGARSHADVLELAARRLLAWRRRERCLVGRCSSSAVVSSADGSSRVAPDAAYVATSQNARTEWAVLPAAERPGAHGRQVLTVAAWMSPNWCRACTPSAFRSRTPTC